jgi:hypothetical protein
MTSKALFLFYFIRMTYFQQLGFCRGFQNSATLEALKNPEEKTLVDPFETLSDP